MASASQVLCEHRDIAAGPARIHVRITGTGPTLVLLPGLGRLAEDLDPFAARLVAAGYRTVQPDPRGNGQSTGPLADISLHDLARDISAVIETTGAGRATIIGHAFGNRIARMVAADRPDLSMPLSCSGAAAWCSPAQRLPKQSVSLRPSTRRATFAPTPSALPGSVPGGTYPFGWMAGHSPS